LNLLQLGEASALSINPLSVAECVHNVCAIARLHLFLFLLLFFAVVFFPVVDSDNDVTTIMLHFLFLTGANVSALTSDSLSILKNAALIAVNQDALGVQGTLRATVDISTDGLVSKDPATQHASATSKSPPRHNRTVAASSSTLSSSSASASASASTSSSSPTPPPPPPPLAAPTSPWMTHCSFGSATDTQAWAIGTTGMHLVQASSQKCLTRSSSGGGGGGAVVVMPCDDTNKNQEWNFGRVNTTVSSSVAVRFGFLASVA
jgi:hypothetical protein